MAVEERKLGDPGPGKVLVTVEAVAGLRRVGPSWLSMATAGSTAIASIAMPRRLWPPPRRPFKGPPPSKMTRRPLKIRGREARRNPRRRNKPPSTSMGIRDSSPFAKAQSY